MPSELQYVTCDYCQAPDKWVLMMSRDFKPGTNEPILFSRYCDKDLIKKARGIARILRTQGIKI